MAGHALLINCQDNKRSCQGLSIPGNDINLKKLLLNQSATSVLQSRNDPKIFLVCLCPHIMTLFHHMTSRLGVK